MINLFTWGDQSLDIEIEDGRIYKSAVKPMFSNRGYKAHYALTIRLINGRIVLVNGGTIFC